MGMITAKVHGIFRGQSRVFVWMFGCLKLLAYIDCNDAVARFERRLSTDHTVSMDREADQTRLKQILTATIASLCNNSLSYSGELTIQGLLGITIDRKDILLININETLGQDGSSSVAQHCQTGIYAEAEHTQSSSMQPLATEMDQNYVSNNSVVAVRRKRAASTNKSTPTSKNKVSKEIISSGNN